MTSCESSLRPLSPWRNRASLGMVLALLAGAASYPGEDSTSRPSPGWFTAGLIRTPTVWIEAVHPARQGMAPDMAPAGVVSGFWPTTGCPDRHPGSGHRRCHRESVEVGRGQGSALYDRESPGDRSCGTSELGLICRSPRGIRLRRSPWQGRFMPALGGPVRVILLGCKCLWWER